MWSWTGTKATYGLASGRWAVKKGRTATEAICAATGIGAAVDIDVAPGPEVDAKADAGAGSGVKVDADAEVEVEADAEGDVDGGMPVTACVRRCSASCARGISDGLTPTSCGVGPKLHQLGGRSMRRPRPELEAWTCGREGQRHYREEPPVPEGMDVLGCMRHLGSLRSRHGSTRALSTIEALT